MIEHTNSYEIEEDVFSPLTKIKQIKHIEEEEEEKCNYHS
jgi:hypothetical protein